MAVLVRRPLLRLSPLLLLPVVALVAGSGPVGCSGEGRRDQGTVGPDEDQRSVESGLLAVVEVAGILLPGERGWVELLNASGVFQSLDGCTISTRLDGTVEWSEVKLSPLERRGSPQAEVGPGGYVVVAWFCDGSLRELPCARAPGLEFGNGSPLQLRLDCPTDNGPGLVDQVTVDPGRTPAVTGSSLALRPEPWIGDAAEHNDDPERWCPAVATPGAPNECALVEEPFEVVDSGIAVVEVYGRPLSNEREWLELYNPTDRQLDLHDCGILYSRPDDPTYPPMARQVVCPAGACSIDPYGYFVFAKTACDGALQGLPCAAYPAIDIATTVVQSLQLVCPMNASGIGPVGDAISWNPLVDQVGKGQSLSLPGYACGATPSRTNDDRNLLCPTSPTPGAPNSRCVERLDQEPEDEEPECDTPWGCGCGGRWCGETPRPAAGDVAFVELHVKPEPGERQWVEVANGTDEPLVLTGCQLVNQRPEEEEWAEWQDLTWDLDTVIPPQGYGVLARNECPWPVDPEEVPCGTYRTIHLSQIRPTRLSLVCPAYLGLAAPDIVVASVEWQDLRHFELDYGQSIVLPEELMEHAGDGSLEHWCVGEATPGAGNGCVGGP